LNFRGRSSGITKQIGNQRTSKRVKLDEGCLTGGGWIEALGYAQEIEKVKNCLAYAGGSSVYSDAYSDPESGGVGKTELGDLVENELIND